jgi:hypothetical protein
MDVAATRRTKPDRVIAHAEDDRDRHGCSFGRQCGHVACRGDHSHLSANQIGHQRRSRKRPKLAKATRTPWPILTVVVIMAED